MICLNCSHGASWNGDSDFDQARLWHAKCKGCECQHGVGSPEGFYDPATVARYWTLYQSSPTTE
jgi:hypothetical protein